LFWWTAQINTSTVLTLSSGILALCCSRYLEYAGCTTAGVLLFTGHGSTMYTYITASVYTLLSPLSVHKEQI
jgi:hypothetical protein